MTHNDSSIWPVSNHPDVVGGAVVFRDSRVPIDTLTGYLRAGHTIDEYRADYPRVTEEQIDQVLKLMRLLLEREVTGAESGELFRLLAERERPPTPED